MTGDLCAVPGVGLKGLHHVQLAMPAGAEDAARDFYSGRLGLAEIQKPPELASRGGVWFANGAISLHIGVEADFRPARKSHVGLEVDDVQRARNLLLDLAPSEIDALPDWRRFYLSDPFGNRIEIVQTV